MLILPNWQHSQDLWQRISASRYDGPHSDLTHMLSWCAAQSCAIPKAAIKRAKVRDAKGAATVSAVRGIASQDQMSIFSAISIESSMPIHKAAKSGQAVRQNQAS